MTAMALAATGVWWRYHGASWLLRDVTLSVRRGELLRVRGGNGSGKSTLLRVFAGCVEPSRGAVVTCGRAAYLPQSVQGLPAVQAGRIHAALAGSRKPSDGRLHRHLGTRADHLSGGTARRLLLDAVLGMPTDLVVLDEPTAGLDVTALHDLAERLRQRLEAGAAVVIADHQPLPVPHTHLLDLGGGGQAAASYVRIVLRGSGTLGGRTDSGGLLTLDVQEDARDAVLLEALQAGWSVLSVQAAA